ncbi:hypothetical protein [Paenarthrobacter nicotinovorans]|uniref:hypothetical protein n=1 Tax=Paenarthrobacter nicotinovorans TaxID=29320 RepID=UPI00119E1598|nr:hypothetical protein [Paenarthrobacter nicotinovorans]
MEPIPVTQTTPAGNSSPQAIPDGPAITWEWLHGTIAAALRQVEPGAPLYITAEVLTDELLEPVKGVQRSAA